MLSSAVALLLSQFFHLRFEVACEVTGGNLTGTVMQCSTNLPMPPGAQWCVQLLEARCCCVLRPCMYTGLLAHPSTASHHSKRCNNFPRAAARVSAPLTIHHFPLPLCASGHTRTLCGQSLQALSATGRRCCTQIAALATTTAASLCPCMALVGTLLAPARGLNVPLGLSIAALTT